MWVVSVIVLLAGGLLGAANLIAAKRPSARDLIQKLTPYQGWIGVVLVLWGVWDVVGVLRSATLLKLTPIWWVLYVITAVTELGLGFLLGFGLISQYVLSSSPQAMEKGQRLRDRLAAYQGPLGIVAVGLAILFTILTVAR